VLDEPAVLVIADSAPGVNAPGVIVTRAYWQGFPVNGTGRHVWARALYTQSTVELPSTAGGGGGVSSPTVSADKTGVSGSGVKGSSTVTVYKNGAQAGTATANSSGVWAYTFGAALQPGDVVAYDGVLTSPPVSVALPAPVNTAAPSISGTAQVGQTLTAAPGSWTGATGAYAYTFSASGVVVQSGASNIYAPQSSDVGKTVTVTVTASNASGATSAASAATSAVLPAPGTGGGTAPPSGFTFLTGSDGQQIAGSDAQDLYGVAA
jgi:hypothetical protein